MPALLYPDLGPFYKNRSSDKDSSAAGPDPNSNTRKLTHFYVNQPAFIGQSVVPPGQFRRVGIHRIEPSAPPIDFNRDHSFTTTRHFHRNILSNDSDHQTSSDNNETVPRSNLRQRRATVAGTTQLNDLNNSKINIRPRGSNYRIGLPTPVSGDFNHFPARRREVTSNARRRREIESVPDAKPLNISPRGVVTLLQQRHQQAMHDKLCCIRSKPPSTNDERRTNQRPTHQRPTNRRPSNHIVTSQRFPTQTFTNLKLPIGDGPRPNPKNGYSRKSSTAPRFGSNPDSENTSPIVNLLNDEVANRQGQRHLKQYSKPFDATGKPSDDEFQGWLSWRRAVNGHFSKSILTHPDPFELSRDREHVTKKQPQPGAMVRVYQEAACGRTTSLEQKTYILFGIPRVTRLHLMDIANKTQPPQKTLRT